MSSSSNNKGTKIGWWTALAVLLAAVVAYQLLQTDDVPCTKDPVVEIPWLLMQQQKTPSSSATTTHHTSRILSITTCNVFSDSYNTARQRFRQAAADAAALMMADDEIIITVTPLHVHQGEMYTMDVAVIRGKLPGLTVHVSGTHGVEGYAGSAIQIAFLQALQQQQEQRDDDDSSFLDTLPTVILVHAFNPVGMAKFRRFNEHNVDLMRNGLTENEWKTFATKRNHWNRENYDKLDSLFNPHHHNNKNKSRRRRRPLITTWWDAYVVSWVRTLVAAARYGIMTLKTAMVGAQYHSPTGISYGGNGHPEPSLLLLKDFMQTFLTKHNDEINTTTTTATTTAVTWIDVHTGLGKMGRDALLPGTSDLPTTTSDIAKLQQWYQETMVEWFPEITFNAKQAAAVAEGYENVKGFTIDYYKRLFVDGNSTNSRNNNKHLFLAQEIGTRHPLLVGRALVVENAAYHDDFLTDAEKLQWAMRTTRSAFYPQTTSFRTGVLQRGLRVLQQAILRSVKLSTTAASANKDSSTASVIT